MTPEAQRIAIAEACGWRQVKSKFEHKSWIRPDGDYGGIGTNSLPDYLSDLNAMHAAVKTLPQNMKPRYFSCLCAVVSGAISLNGYSEATEATAAQRARAFLQTLNLWTP